MTYACRRVAVTVLFARRRRRGAWWRCTAAPVAGGPLVARCAADAKFMREYEN
jgi:hypothetical protein